MIAQALQMVEVDLEKCVSQAQGKVENLNTEHEGLRAALTDAEAKLASSQETLVTAKQALEASTSGEAAAKADLASAQAALSAKDDELAGEISTKQRLENAKELYEDLKASKQQGKELRASLKTLTKTTAEFGLEDAVVDAVSEVLLKEASTRGTFDSIVLQQVDAKFPEWFSKVESSIKACEDLKIELPKSVANADQHYAAKVSELSASKAALQTATAAVSENSIAVKEASVALKTFEKGMPSTTNALEEAHATLSAFKEGPSKVFEELKNFEAPQLVPETAPVAETVSEATPVVQESTE
jgi:chromosome segregation ATPase